MVTYWPFRQTQSGVQMSAGGFSGTAPNGRSYDWKSWDGKPYGYEGLLVDGYLTLLAVLSR